MNISKTVLLVLLSAFMMTMAACGGGGGGGGGGNPPQAGNTDTDGDGIPNANDAAPNDVDTFALFNTATTLTNPSLGDFSMAVDINTTGTVVGMADTAGDINKAARWSVDASSAQVNSETLESLDLNYSAAYAVNDGGMAAGESSNGADIVPVVWPLGATGALAVPLIAGGGPNGSAYSINNAGQLAGEAEDSNGNLVAVFWSDSVSAPSGLPGLGGPTSSAYYLNDAGEAVGEAEDGSGLKHAVFWDISANDIAQLPMLNATDTGALAMSINVAGEIVGEIELADGTRTAVLWTPDGAGGFNVNDLGITSAAGMNDSTRIVGNDMDVAAIWDTRSSVLGNNNAVVTSTARSQAYDVNGDEIVVGILGNTAFAAAPQ